MLNHVFSFSNVCLLCTVLRAFKKGFQESQGGASVRVRNPQYCRYWHNYGVNVCALVRGCKSQLREHSEYHALVLDPTLPVIHHPLVMTAIKNHPPYVRSISFHRINDVCQQTTNASYFLTPWALNKSRQIIEKKTKTNFLSC